MVFADLILLDFIFRDSLLHKEQNILFKIFSSPITIKTEFNGLLIEDKQTLPNY